MYILSALKEQCRVVDEAGIQFCEEIFMINWGEMLVYLYNMVTSYLR
jgi:hypothetical protein